MDWWGRGEKMPLSLSTETSLIWNGKEYILVDAHIGYPMYGASLALEWRLMEYNDRRGLPVIRIKVPGQMRRQGVGG
jgi:hypothetical protein